MWCYQPNGILHFLQCRVLQVLLILEDIWTTEHMPKLGDTFTEHFNQADAKVDFPRESTKLGFINADECSRHVPIATKDFFPPQIRNLHSQKCRRFIPRSRHSRIVDRSSKAAETFTSHFQALPKLVFHAHIRHCLVRGWSGDSESNRRVVPSS